MQKNTASFYGLSPQEVLDGVQNSGLMPTGEYVQLNSYENRVFDVFLEKGMNPPELFDHVIVKFYRPHRWDELALRDEHDFLAELNEAGIPAIAPLIQNNQQTLSLQSDLWMTLFPKGMGRLPQELNKEQRVKIGKLLARVHNVGAQRPAASRPDFSTEYYGYKSLDELQHWVAPEVWTRYEAAAENILEFLDDWLNPDEFIRIHGDCHLGNLLMLDKVNQPQQFFLVDFDDFCNGPVAQDFWMLLPDTIQNAKEELNNLIEGYEEFRTFKLPDLRVFEALRGLRVIYYAGWIAKRYSDPTFPNLFPQFKDYNYWATDVEELEKIAWQL